MMATEATSDPETTKNIYPDHDLNPIETPSQDVPSEQPIVNGSTEKHENRPDTEHLEPNGVNSAEVSVSGGSDTEATKAETSKGSGEEKGHVRNTSTVKKLASFKPVSVNKTFLAAKGATPATPSKLGEKVNTGSVVTQPGPSATGLSARPRLVAKLGSGLQSTPKAAGAANGGKPGAPDASAVWNKNRPAPPPEPKRFTDEELKQRYGIHLATRLQSDDPSKQTEKNWADIDDDDDDWAPETIEWTDGTKITLPTADETPVPAPEPVPAPVPKVVENVKPKSPVPSSAAASPTVRPAGFAGGRAGLVLKGAAEKPTLVAKPPGPPTPVKSPWASLPPVDKVAPVAIEIPQPLQPSQSRFTQRDPHSFQGMPPPPAKEIAADDFSRESRSWREAPNASRELYNSQSGRYEPANENRRGSVRNDARSHQPAVLQRPFNNDEPAGPSAAFQTHRAGGQDGPYRRRTSSNVSGGSGNFNRRFSRGDMPPPHEMLRDRRGSLVAVSDEPASPRNFSPSGNQFSSARGHPRQQSRASPVVSQNSPQSAQGQVVPPAATSPVDPQNQPPNAVYEDPLVVQKRLMQEKRKLAIERRKEEEAREEEAKKARIAAKLASMGPPPEPKKKEAPKEDKVAPTQIQTREAKEAVAATQSTAATQEPSTESKAAPPKSEPELKPDMALGTSSLDGASGENEATSRDKRSNGVHRQDQNSQERSSQWQNNDSSTYTKPWAATSAQQGSRNVWGPPTNDRTLGNGTFNSELSRVPEMNSSNPGSIGPPNRGNAQPGQGRDSYTRPAPIGPPSRRRQEQNIDPAARTAVAKSGWGALPTKISQEDRAVAEVQDAERARIKALREQGIAPPVQEASQTVLQDTWRQVSIREDGTRGRIEANHATVHGGDPSQSRGIFEEQDNAQRRPLEANVQQPQFNESWQSASNTGPPPRASRFFNNNRDIRLEEQQMHFERPGSPTPPPPTMAGHPAYDGDSRHPHVSLPRPPPIVKLPPVATPLAPIGPPARPVSFAAAVSAPAVPIINHTAQNRASQYQEFRKEAASSGGWQERINTLVGRKQSPPKSHALAVDSSSKSALEVPGHQSSATVSLPSSASGDIATEAGAVESKPAAEECFEEQEMGSLPNIKVPHMAPEAAWNPAQSQPRKLPKRFQINDSTSSDSAHFPLSIKDSQSQVTIHLPGHEDEKVVGMPLPASTRQKSNPRRGGGSRGGPNSRHSSSNHPRGGRREGSNGFPHSPNHDNSSSNPDSSGPNRSGRGRGFGSNWSRNTPTPVHT